MKSASALPIGLLLAAGLCLLPFLVPYHQQPVLSFFSEWLAAALGTAAVLAILSGRGLEANAALPAPALWLAAFALFLAARAALGDQAYRQISLLAALYVLYAVLMVQLGSQLAVSRGLEGVALVFAGFLLAGALANSAAGIIQFYGRPMLFEDFVAELRGSRAYGNIAQPNLYANYLALGEGALAFLWVRGSARSAYALPALVLLVVASALSGSRSALLYAFWFAALGLLAARIEDRTGVRRLKAAAYAVASAAASAYFAVPLLNGALGLGPSGDSGLDRLLAFSGEHPDVRLPVFALALRVFATAPIAGVGMGEFAGAAFNLGLDPALTRSGDVWTSPHNLLLHLLAETGVVGAALILGALAAWIGGVLRRCRASENPVLWWMIAAVGIELIHSLIEFPLWSAHFLGVTALLIGASTSPEMRSPTISRSARIGALGAGAVLALALAILLRDYVRLDTTRVTGTTVTLARAADAQRDAATMRELTNGLMAPVAELWILIGTPLDRSDLASKLAMCERVSRIWPSNPVVVRRAVFLAFDARGEEAKSLLARALRSFPQRRDDTISILERARAGDPGAIEPLLAMARAAPSPAVAPRR